MISSWAVACQKWGGRWIPHPFVLALGLNLLVLTVALLSWPEGRPIQGVSLAWYRGFAAPSMLAFGFQMAWMLVLGHAIAEAPLVRRGLHGLAARWRTAAQAILLVTLASMALSLLNWGLGLVGGAFLAREVGREAQRRQQPLPYALIVAAAYSGFLVWHGGLSGSAPLKVAELGHPFEEFGGVIPIRDTLLGPLNLGLLLALAIAVPWLWIRMLPAAQSAVPKIDPPQELEAAAQPSPMTGAGSGTGTATASAKWLARGFVLAASVAAAVGIFGFGIARGVEFDLSAVLFLTLLLGLGLHGSPRRFARAVETGARETGGILLQFPFYFAVLGVLRESGLAERLARGCQDLAVDAHAWGLPLEAAYLTLTFFLAALVNVFVPSGGGQWALQGEIVLRGAASLGLPPERAVMAFAHGDAWSNLLQPFWALALLSVTRTRARDIGGYTVALMILILPVYLLALTLI